MSLVVVGINHRTAPVEIRERVVFEPVDEREQLGTAWLTRRNELLDQGCASKEQVAALLDEAVDAMVTKIMYTMPDCTTKTTESVRKKKLEHWDKNKETNRAWLANNMMTEAKAVAERLAHAAREMPAGDPRDPAFRIGPMISEADAKRAVAVAVRNRWRRQQLTGVMRQDESPKNFLMIGKMFSVWMEMLPCSADFCFTVFFFDVFFSVIKNLPKATI